ncbi:MAG TPA: type II toxin-antitoxin system PemK/MazF family toxin [Chloroflexota bacterium]|nr:type II toxin-antitoxin system PemK/MazF family toxin [Chloroflexota bacterium]
MLRGEVYDARLDPTEGSEQAGTRPVIIVSRNAINSSSSVILAVPCTTYRGRHLYPSHILLRAPEGGLAVDSVAMAEQVRALSKTRLLVRRGILHSAPLAMIERGLLVALDLPLATE